MAEKKPFRNVRLVFKNDAHPGVKIAIIATLIVCTITLVALGIGIGISKANTQAMQQEAAGIAQENSELRQDIAEFGTLKSLKELAKKFLGLVDPDSVFFSPED